MIERRRCVLASCLVLLSIGMLVCVGTTATARAQCAVAREQTMYAWARADLDDYLTNKATDEIEVPVPYLNPCTLDGSSVPPTQRWAAQVLWVFTMTGGSPQYIVETGVRRICTIGAPKTVFFLACCNGMVGYDSYLRAPNNELLTPVIGAAYEFNLEHKTDCDTYLAGNQTGWCVNIFGPGLPATGSQHWVRSPNFTAGRYVQVGAENLYDINDMGVSGHLNPRYWSNGVLNMLWGDNVDDRRSDSPRYILTEGSHSKNYFQDYSDIHFLREPTPAATTDACAPGQ